MRRHLAHSSVNLALRRSDHLTQITSIIGAVEDLSRSGVRARSEYLGYRVARVSNPQVLRSLRRVFHPRVEQGVALGKIAAALLLAVLEPKSGGARACRAYQLAGHWYSHIRTAGYGQDGSDHALTVQHAGQLLAAFSRRGGRLEQTVLVFLAAQGVLSYAASGLVKLISPVWRSGAAMPGITRTTSYGDAKLYRMMSEYPPLAKAISWATIVGETVAPLAVFSPRFMRLAWQLSMLVMHMGIARYMGLNRFLWAFAAFHPIIDHVSVFLADQITTTRKPLVRKIRR